MGELFPSQIPSQGTRAKPCLDHFHLILAFFHFLSWHGIPSLAPFLKFFTIMATSDASNQPTPSAIAGTPPLPLSLDGGEVFSPITSHSHLLGSDSKALSARPWLPLSLGSPSLGLQCIVLLYVDSYTVDTVVRHLLFRLFMLCYLHEMVIPLTQFT